MALSMDSLARIALDLQWGISNQDRFQQLINSLRQLLLCDALALLRYEGQLFRPLAIDGLGRFTKTGSALLIMGIAGGAIIPQAYAWLALKLGAQPAFFWCTLPCYLYILYYALRGNRAGRTALESKI